MKILHINYSDINGGAATVSNRLHISLLKNKVNSWLLVNEKLGDIEKTVGIRSSYETKIHKIKKIFAKEITKFFNTKNKYSDSIAFFNSNLIKRINIINPDLVNLHWICNEMISIEQIAKIKKPLVWTLMDMWPFCGAEHYATDNRFLEGYNKNNKPLDTKFIDINRWVWNRKKKILDFDFNIVCTSKWLANKAKESILFKNKKISVINPNIDINEWKPIDKQSARKILNFELNKKYLVFSAMNGTNDFRKGFDIFLRAVEILKINKNDLHLIIIGDANSKNLINSDIKYTSHKIYYSNTLSLRLLYSASDLLVVPSRQEAFGQVATEAGSCETPSIVFKNTGLEDIVDHKINGYLANYLSFEDLASGIEWSLDDANNYKIGKNARKEIIKKFSNEVIANKYKELYLSLIK
jgi:glycosyltransferase involved in cell wall biosynthesis|tara:strand:- start:1411 stop:2643 length:1233 start_codon:yes stop_codon:yes gene_type:complete